MKDEIKMDLLRKLILNLYFENREVPNIKYFSDNKLIRDIDSSKLRVELQHSWKDYLSKSVDIIEFQEEFLNRYRDWQHQMTELNGIKTKTDMKEFVNNYLKKDIQLGYNLGDISDEEIKDLIKYKEPNISTDFQGKVNRTCNLVILAQNQLNLTLHLKLDSFKENSFLGTVIFSFWFEKPNEKFSLDMDYINNWYFSHVLGRKLMSKLEIRNYKKVDLFNSESYDVEYFEENEKTNLWLNSHPEMIITYVKKILNANPVRILDEIIVDIKDIKGEEKSYKLQNNYNPHSWFENLSEELKQFYNKGKEIFLDSTKLLERASFSEVGQPKKEKTKISKEKLSLENLIFLFNKAMENDLKNDIDVSVAGFRTQNSLFDEFLNKKTRNEKYNFIEPVSRGTFYSRIEKYRSELSYILERNSSRGHGGGDAFRIKKSEIVTKMPQDIVSENIYEDFFLEIREKIHEGLIYYEEKNYEYAISVFKEILNSKNSLSKIMKPEYLGVLYSLGKSYMKKGLFKPAKKQFETIFALDKKKLDSRFNLLVCYYNLSKYEKAYEIARFLFEDLYDSLNPYSSLNMNYKELLYKEDLSFFYLDSEKIHPNLFKREIFDKHLIMMNRYYTEIDLIHLRPKYDSDWEDYQGKLSEFKDKKKKISKNVTSYRKLKLIQLNVEKYILEIYRKLITRRLIFREKVNNFASKVDEILDTLNNYLIEGRIKQESLNNFLSYTIKLSQLYFKKEKNIISDTIFKKFRNFDIKLKIGGFPKQTQFITNFLYFATSVINTNNYNWAKKELRKNFNKPDLELELFCLELFQIKEIELTRLNIETQDRLSKFAASEYTEYIQLFDNWKYEMPLLNYFGIKEFMLNVNTYIEMAKENGLKDFESLIIKFSSELIEKIKEFQKLQSEGRKITYKLIFSEFYNKFKVNIKNEMIDYSVKPEKFSYKKISQELSNQLFSILHKSIVETKVKIKVFNKEILNYFFNEIISLIRIPNTVELNIEKNEINIQKYKETKIDGNVLLFDQYIDYFVMDLFDNFKFGTNKLILRYSPEFEENLNKFFTEQFQIETSNPYFEFLLEHDPQHLYYFIKIKVKEVT